jgi:BASS family bile acid:Na+ symporter
MLRNTNAVFISAIIAGLALPALSDFFVGYVLLALIIIMTFSTTQITLSFADLKGQLRQVFSAFLVNYVFLSGIIVLSSWILLEDPDLIAGFVIMAAVPPAIAVVPLTGLLRGNTSLSLISSTFLYLLSPILAPLIVYLAAGFTGIDVLALIKVLVELILLPLLFSRMLMRLKPYQRIKEDQIIIINACFFILIYAVVGVNRGVFFRDFSMVALVSGICILRTFASGTIIYLLAKGTRVENASAVSYTLFGSYKNLGLTATMALALLGERACIPAAICIPFEILLLSYFSWLTRQNIP